MEATLTLSAEQWNLLTGGIADCRSRVAPRPRRVIAHGPATIVWWDDGTKTVVKRHSEEDDPEKALAMALARRVWGRSRTARYVKSIERGDA